MSSTEAVHLIREVAIRYVGARRRVPEKFSSPAQAAVYFRRRIHDDAREHLVALYLDGRHRAIADAIVSIGTATASLVHPREVLQPAIAVGTCALLIGQNYPSGDPSPSPEGSPRQDSSSESSFSTTLCGLATAPSTRSAKRVPRCSRRRCELGSRIEPLRRNRLPPPPVFALRLRR